MINKKGNIKKPDFFIVGAPKCGTTSMDKYISQHPDVFMARGEPRFFGSDIRYDRKLTNEDYLGCFSEAQNERRVGEKSVWYLYSRRAAAEIKRFCPHAKIIIQVRNPVDMLYSLHAQFVYHSGREDIVDFKEALDAEEDRRRGLRIPKHGGFLENFFYSEIPLYTEQINRYVDAFGWNQIHIIVFDDLVSNTPKVYRDVLRFLEVDDQFIPDAKVHNPGSQLKSLMLRDLMRDSWMARAATKVLLPGIIRRPIGQIFSRWNISNKPRPPMDKRVCNRLQEQFAPEVERLSKLLDRDLSHWCKD